MSESTKETSPLLSHQQIAALIESNERQRLTIKDLDKRLSSLVVQEREYQKQVSSWSETLQAHSIQNRELEDLVSKQESLIDSQNEQIKFLTERLENL